MHRLHPPRVHSPRVKSTVSPTFEPTTATAALSAKRTAYPSRLSMHQQQPHEKGTLVIALLNARTYVQP